MAKNRSTSSSTAAPLPSQPRPTAPAASSPTNKLVDLPLAGLGLVDQGWVRWSVRWAALAAALLSGFLIYLKYQGSADGVIGCGEATAGGSGCLRALHGRWASWLGLPVGVLAVALYTGLLGLTLPRVQRWVGRPTEKLLMAGALVAVLGAVWFTILMVSERLFCPYCLAVHLCGTGLGLILFWSAWKTRQEAARKLFPTAGLVATLGFAGLVLGQLLTPPPALPKITAGPAISTPPQDFTLADSPHQTSPNARYVLTEYFDYTCGACRDMADDLAVLLSKHGAELTIIYHPCPLHAQCNAHLPPTVEPHRQACDFAKLSLAVWRKAPQQWLKFHKNLFADAKRYDYESAERTAMGLLGGPHGLAAALEDPWVTEKINTTCAQYGKLVSENIKMPKLIMPGNRPMHGIAASTEDFIRAVEKELGLGLGKR